MTLHKAFPVCTLLHLALSQMPNHAAIEIRGSLDIGSGSIKLLLAEVDTHTNKIVKYVHSDLAGIPFSDDLANSKQSLFSDHIQLQARNSLNSLLTTAKAFQPKKIVGIATEAFRHAENGQQLISVLSNEFNLPLKIISQLEESELGFYSVLTIAQTNPENTVVWDIGSGSFQISWQEEGQIFSYVGQIGPTFARNTILNVQGKELSEKSSVHPISYSEFKKAQNRILQTLECAPLSLKNKLVHPETKVYGIGGAHRLASTQNDDTSYYSLDLVNNLVKRRLNLCDKQFDQNAHQLWVSDLIFLSSLMTHLNIDNVFDIHFFNQSDIYIGGNTAGILLYAKYWD